MKGIISLLLLLVLNTVFCSAVSLRQRLRSNPDDQTNPSSNESESVLQERYFEQKLDHYNPDNDQKWNQRYWSYPLYYKSGGPAFLFVNGESAARVNWNTQTPDSGLSYAKALNAHCFSLEHRFYGKSWPENGKMMYHLTSEQAVADIANFIRGATEEYKLPRDTKWIVFGGSYAGSLAAWARLKFPYFVHGAIASSAPLLVKTDYNEYYQIVEESLKSYDPRCVESISTATREILSLINNTDANTNSSRSRLFGSCGTPEKNITKEVKSLISDVLDILATAVQYNDSISANIPAICDTMINHKGPKFEAFAQLKKSYKRSSLSSTMWDYQTCTEFGYFSSFNKTTSLLPLNDLLPIEGEIKETCEQFFGPEFGKADINEKVDYTNMIYGGVDFNTGNTVFIHGSLDPWHRAGIYQKKNGAAYETIFIKGTSHCADRLSASDNDSQELKTARQKVLEILKKWLNK